MKGNIVNDLAPLAGYLYIRGLIEEDYNFNDAMDFTRKVSECLDYFIIKLDEVTNNMTKEQVEEYIMYEVYEAGKIHFPEELRLWFKILYQIFIKEENGPRMGQFIRIWGVDMALNRVYEVRTRGY